MINGQKLVRKRFFIDSVNSPKIGFPSKLMSILIQMLEKYSLALLNRNVVLLECE